MRKILITGGSGFIGYHFHQVLPHESIVNLDLREPDFDYRSTYIKGDIRKPEDVLRALKEHACDLVINLAAEHKDFGITKEEYFKTNEYGTKVVAEAAAQMGIKKFVFYSSVAIYGNNKLPSTETTTPAPVNYYGESKLAGEKVLHHWLSEDPKREVLVLRPTVVYGEENVANMYRLIKQVNSGMYFNIGKEEYVKSIAYVKNLVAATLFLIDRTQAGFQVYNYADTPQMSTHKIGEIIAKALGKKKPITLPYGLIYMLGLPFDLLIKITGKDLPISTNRIKKLCTQTYHTADKLAETGFKPTYGNKEGLEAMVKWFLNPQKAPLPKQSTVSS